MTDANDTHRSLFRNLADANGNYQQCAKQFMLLIDAMQALSERISSLGIKASNPKEVRFDCLGEEWAIRMKFLPTAFGNQGGFTLTLHWFDLLNDTYVEGESHMFNRDGYVREEQQPRELSIAEHAEQIFLDMLARDGWPRTRLE